MGYAKIADHVKVSVRKGDPKMKGEVFDAVLVRQRKPLKRKTGDAVKMVDRAEATAKTKQGIVGIKVAVLAPGVKMCDQIVVDEELLEAVKRNVTFEEVEETVKKVKKKRKAVKKKAKVSDSSAEKTKATEKKTAKKKAVKKEAKK